MSHMLDVDALLPVPCLLAPIRRGSIPLSLKCMYAPCVLACAGALLPGDQIKTIQGREFKGQGWDSLGRYMLDETVFMH